MENKNTKSMSFSSFLILFSSVDYSTTFFFYEVYYSGILSVQPSIVIVKPVYVSLLSTSPPYEYLLNII